MKERRRLYIGVTSVAWLLWSPPHALATSGVGLAAAPPADAAADETQFFRVFLSDGTSLTSVGEPARLGDRVIFSMPTSAAADGLESRLVDLPADCVNWTRTDEYTEAVRATRYLATRADADYAVLATQVQRWLDDVAVAPSAAARLTLAEQVRRVLADWPAGHYGYKRDEIRQMVTLLDEIIADLRATLGYQQFDVSLVATTEPPPARPLLIAAPGRRETIEETIAAARLSPSPSDRAALLAAALEALDRPGDLPADWVTATRSSTAALLQQEQDLDRRYRSLHDTSVESARSLAAAADVRGVERLLARARLDDDTLQNARPDVFAATLAALEKELDAARQLRLARDRWTLRRPVLRQYREAMASALSRLQRMVPALDDIKSLAGSPPEALAFLLDATYRVRLATRSVTAPEEMQNVHGLIASAAQLAENAATLRREATLTGRMDQAWNASSAAAGALMLVARAQQELQAVLGMPQRPE